MSEIATQKAILDYLQLKRHFCWRNNSGAFKTERGSFYRVGTPGAPDIICCIAGQFVDLEVKSETGGQSATQKHFEKSLAAAGGRYHIVRCLDDVQRLGCRTESGCSR